MRWEDGLVREDDRLRRRGIAAVWLATFLWAWGPVLVKWSSLPGPTFAMLRLWVGVLVSFVAIAATGRRFTWTAFRACGIGGVLFAADIGLGFTAVKITTVADVALIGALAPVVIVLVSARRLHERITMRSWALVGASFSGVVIVALASAGLPSGSLAGALTMTPVALVANGVPNAVSASDAFAVVAVALLPGFVGHTLVIWSHRHVASWL